MTYAAVTGRNQALSAAELYAMAKPFKFETSLLGKYAVLLHGFDPEVAHRLGGTTKLVAIKGVAPTPEEAVDALVAPVKRSTQVDFGVSVYGKADATRLAGRAKRKLKANGVASRFVPVKRALSTAQVLHNNLVKNGYEWCLFESTDGWHYGRTVWIQDLEGFAKRDYGKPSSDAKRGMLPPKLARTMVNLASLKPKHTIYDPFCGSGVLLMEALLLGYSAYGSDISPQAVADTRKNVGWIKKQHAVRATKEAVADASFPLPFNDADAIVTEGYLGHPLRQAVSYAEIMIEAKTVTSLMLKFFEQAAKVQQPGQRLVVTLPSWKLANGLQRLPVVDQAKALGYTVVRPVPDDWQVAGLQADGSIEVSRPDQRVIHNLYTLERT